MIAASNAATCASTCSCVTDADAAKSLALFNSTAALTVLTCLSSDNSCPANDTNKLSNWLILAWRAFLFTSLAVAFSAFGATSFTSAVFVSTAGVSALATSAFSSVAVAFSVAATVASSLLVSAACAAPPRNIKADAIRTDAVPALNFLIP